MNEPQVRAIFNAIDKNGDGSITKKELRNFFRKQFPDMEKKELEEYMNHVDINHDGKITFDELKRVLTKRGI
ncbi:hypothetical protein D915_000538 [Fasciola hepatica]|uniref:EF-hand domain-containing protein n=1 Tax=Fasciola hepatica TaxID=6192 RepID=A0A4E0RNS5_FASHE|nr:hypothetical protein D915_000538 [Fasciola hepatica]